MDEMTNAAPPAVPGPGLLARIVGIITSPKATFERIVPAPRVAGMLAALALFAGVCQGAFLLTARGQQAFLEVSAQQTEKFFGRAPTDEESARLEKMAPIQAYLTMAGSLVAVPVIVAIEAGVLYAIFTFGTGGVATFKQVAAVVAHSSVINMLDLLFTVAMQFARGTISLTGPANLGVLLPMLDDTGWLAHFLGLIDLFRVWWVITLAIGLGVLYRRKSRNIAIGLFVTYAVVISGVAYFMSGRS